MSRQIKMSLVLAAMGDGVLFSDAVDMIYVTSIELEAKSGGGREEGWSVSVPPYWQDGLVHPSRSPFWRVMGDDFLAIEYTIGDTAYSSKAATNIATSAVSNSQKASLKNAYNGAAFPLNVVGGAPTVLLAPTKLPANKEEEVPNGTATNDDDDLAEWIWYAIIGGTALCLFLCAVAVVCCCCKGSRSHDDRDTVKEDNLTRPLLASDSVESTQDVGVSVPPTPTPVVEHKPQFVKEAPPRSREIPIEEDWLVKDQYGSVQTNPLDANQAYASGKGFFMFEKASTAASPEYYTRQKPSFQQAQSLGGIYVV